MSMTKDAIKKFVEQDFKGHAIMVVCDNEHIFFHNTGVSIPLIWDWDNNVFMALEDNDKAESQNHNPMQVTMVSLDEIQFITALIDAEKALKFINSTITDVKAKEIAKKKLQSLRPAMMKYNTLREGYHTEREEYLGVQK